MKMGQKPIAVALLVFSVALTMLFCLNRPRISVVILAGQSNAVGWASVFGQDGDEEESPKSKNLLWYLQGNPKKPTSSNGWTQLSPQTVHGRRIFGPEAGIAEWFSANGGMKVAIIKIAFNGTGLRVNEGFDWNPVSKLELYEMLVRQTQSALKALKWTHNVRLVGLCWIQGESDARTLSDMGGESFDITYKADLNKLLQALKKDLKQPELKSAIAVISPPDIDSAGRVFTNRERIQNAQLQVGTQRNNVSFLTDDLQKSEDQLHFNFSGSLTLGSRCADALLQPQS